MVNVIKVNLFNFYSLLLSFNVENFIYIILAYSSKEERILILMFIFRMITILLKRKKMKCQ